MMQENRLVHLFWTGGWDSTFRLLYVLLRQKRDVQPHYLIDADRKSTGIELGIRDKIKETLFSRYPEAKDRLCPTIFFDRTELPNMPEVTESYHRLHQRNAFGSQYEWMAKYCMMQNLQVIETCIHSGGTAGRMLDSLVVLSDTERDRYYSVDPLFEATDEYKIFGHYHFPVYDIHKPEMEKIARESGWLDIMKLTWFCLRPMADGTPCGRCHPCSLVMKAGLTWRLPLKSRILYYATLRPYTNTMLFRTARHMKHLFVPRPSPSQEG